jgi:hypothetical protein
MEDEFGPLDWYRAKTVEQMRSDLVTMAQGNYFNDEQEYAFMAGGELVIRTGADLNDQAPEGPGPEEYQQMSEEQIVEQYVSRIKMYPPFVDIADQEGFAKAYLPALDNMNNVASVYGNKVQYGNGMELASEIQTGAITDYIATGFKDKEEFYKWYLSDVANNQAVLQPGQTQAEDFSIVDEDFYKDTMDTPNTVFPQRPEEQPTPPPNTRFPQRPQTQGKQDLFKQPARSYYSLLKELTKVGEAVTEGTKDFLGSAARGPVEFGKKVVEGVQDNMETAEKGPSLREIIDRLREIGREGAFNPNEKE